MNKILTISIAILLMVMSGCNKKGESSASPATYNTDTVRVAPVIVKRQGNLTIYRPHYANIDLVCGTMPPQHDQNVIFCAEAAFTGALLDHFDHFNIATDHVSGGKRYRGYRCARNTGAFVYYNGIYEFGYKNYSAMLDTAAAHGGMGFGQEMLIHEGKVVPKKRKDNDVNEFRALCDYNGELCVIDSNGKVKFGDFIAEMVSIGVNEALYLDMGYGWNYSWWRDANGLAHEIHSDKIPYTTNWITFYATAMK